MAREVCLRLNNEIASRGSLKARNYRLILPRLSAITSLATTTRYGSGSWRLLRNWSGIFEGTEGNRSNEAMPTEKGWAVVGPYGLYTGWWMTRKAAIEAHVSGKVLGPSSDRWVRTRRVHDVWELSGKGLKPNKPGERRGGRQV